MIKVSDYIVNFIANMGVKTVFMLAGGQAMHIVDSIGRNKHINFVCALHEQAASMMAEAYSRATDNFGVAVVTTGPGGTNAMTGVAGAWLDSTPCMIISGQFRVENTIGKLGIRQTCLQGTNPVELVKPITKYAVMIEDPKTIRYHLEKAVYMAKNGRPGPVWLDIPLDIQSAMIDEADLMPFNEEEINIQSDNIDLKSAVKEIIAFLQKARRPVILAGNGIRLSKSIDKFHTLVEKLGIPVLTSINGIDLIHDAHPLYMGRPNYWGQRAANFIVQNADVLLTIGAGLHLETTGFNYKAFAREAKKIIVDIDPNELNKPFIKPDVKVLSDAGVFINEMLIELKDNMIADKQEWLDICRSWKAEFPLILPEFFENKDFVNPFVFTDVLSDELSDDDIIIPGSAGSHFTTSVQCFKVKKGQRVFSEIGIGAMGHSLPSAIAASIANDGKRSICITGDGGIQLNIQELQTIITYNLPVKIFLMNNGGYMSIRNTQNNFFNKAYAGCNKESGLIFPDMIKIAEAYGFKTNRITNNNELKDKIREVLDEEGAVFCEVMLDPDAKLIPNVGSQKLEDGKMISSPLEDMSPLLDRETFMKHMFIEPWR